jgi:antitoxin (DNA-binding transcriptional repressor) of toxin-antitoxin stability system
VKTITAVQFCQSPTAVLADVEAGATYVVTRHNREVAYIIPRTQGIELTSRKRPAGTNLSGLPRRQLKTAPSLEGLLAEERDR